MSDRELVERVAQLERRVAVLEYQQSKVASGAHQAAESARLESALGLTWLNRAGAAVLVAGVLLAAAWAYDEGYLTPALRNGLMGAVSAGLALLGVRQLHSDRDASARFGLGLAIVGLAGALVTLYSLAHYDEMVSPPFAVSVGVAMAAALAALGNATRSEAMVALAAACGASVPLLASALAPSSALLEAGAVGVVAVALQRRRGWSLPGLVAAVAAVGYSVALPPDPALVAAVMALFVAAHVDCLVRESAASTASRTAAVLAVAAMAAAWMREGDFATAAAAGFAVAALGWIGRDALLIAAATVATGLALALSGGPAVQTASASVTGLVLIGVGARYSDPRVRHAGVAALLVALAKLALFDLWSASAALRVVVLFVLGSALLGASYLYSRHVQTDADGSH